MNGTHWLAGTPFLRHLQVVGSHAHQLAGLVLLPDIARTRPVIPYKDGAEPRGNSASLEGINPAANVVQDDLGDRSSCEELRAHGRGRYPRPANGPARRNAELEARPVTLLSAGSDAPR